ncbi:MAG: CPBP family intramembrane glutamic endopeptidase [Candidatus Kariarchaeaceae archaeon]|jgi:membrane protease YdiL (CAAX protease family)
MTYTETSTVKPETMEISSSPTITVLTIILVLAVDQIGGILDLMIYLDLMAEIETEMLHILGVPMAMLTVFAIVKARGGSLTQLGLRRPDSWTRLIVIGVGIAILLQLIAYVNTYLFYFLGVPLPDYSQYAELEGNIGYLLFYIPVVAWLSAGLGEEVIWRGFVLQQIASLADNSKRGVLAGLLISSFLFGLIHYNQGVTGIAFTTIAGLFLGVIFLKFNRILWYSIVVHGMMNTIAFLTLFLGINLY